MAAALGARAVSRAGGARIQIEGAGKSFGAGTTSVPVLVDITLDVAPGELLCLLGPSGCGKSTLLNIIAGFIPLTAGRVLVDGTPVSGPGADRGVVFQEYVLFPWLTVAHNVEFGPRLAGVDAAERSRLVARYLDIVGLTAHADKFPIQLSGGMKQRVAIARALANSPSIVLMDEPFGALDAQTREVLQEELVRIRRVEPKTIVFVTHSIREAVYLADRIAVMASGPGRIKQMFTIKLPDERDRFSPDFIHYEVDVTRAVREEVGKVHE
jgi:NitT/TauT family transport system ATP-binding protein